MSYWELNDAQRRSFLGRMFRFGTLDGPQELYSFSSSPERPRKPDILRPGRRDAMYFLSRSNLLESIQSSASHAVDVFEFIRDGVALCEDWNSMNWVFILDVPPGMTIEAWFGQAKFQPRISAREEKRRGVSSSGSLAGGWLQYLIELDDRLIHFVRGPIATGC